jgi:hypothetical protein
MSKIYSIKCSNCAAPLNLLGGGRVETVTCAYCKSVIDLNDNYKVLSNFKDYKEKNKLPFEIGMKGILNTIEYTIIGRVTYREVEPPFGEWSDFLLFSPLYGYAYLTYEEGHLIYSQRDRHFPNIEWKEISKRYLVHVANEKFEPYDHYTAKVVYVEGELTWVAKKGDNTSFIDLIAPPFGISAEKSKDEIEFYKTEYLEASMVYDAFTVEEDKRIFNDEFNPLKPFNRPLLKALSKISLWIMVIVAFLFLAIGFDGLGTNIKAFDADNSKVYEEKFILKSNKYLSSLKLTGSSHKMLSNFNIQIHKNQQLIFSLNGKKAYSFKEGSTQIKTKFNQWDKDAKAVTIYLKLKKLGEYTITVKPINKTVSSKLRLTIYEQDSRLNYFQMFFFFLLITFFIYKFYASRHRSKLEHERGIYYD